jgi:outer membrane receptor for ferrienterochelin and colicin
LTPETSLNTDLSLRFIGNDTSFSATVYQNWIDNYIYLFNTGYYRNATGTARATSASSATPLIEMSNGQTDAVIRGIELVATWDITRAMMLESGLEMIEGEDSSHHRTLSLMPANHLRLKAHYRLGQLGNWQENRISLGARFVDSKSAVFPWEPFSQYDKLSTGSASTDAYTLWDLGYTTHYQLEKQKVTLLLSVENLLDTAHYDFLDTYKGYAMSMGRNARLTAKLAF